MTTTLNTIKIFSITILIMLLMFSFCILTNADEPEGAVIQACRIDNTEEGMICAKLKSMLGSSSTVQYSLTETDTCKYSTSITLSNGSVKTVYLSQKPNTGDVGVQMCPYCQYIYFDNHNCDMANVKYCSVNDKDALCTAIVDLYANDLSQYQQRISYKTERTDTYKYEAEFDISGLTHVLYFDKLPSGTEPTDKCSNGYVTEKVCRRLYDVVGNNTPFSLRYTPFFRYSAEIELEDGNTTTIWLLTELTQEQEYALMFDKRPIKNDGASLKQIITTSVFFDILGIGLFVAIFIIVSKRKRA